MTAWISLDDAGAASIALAAILGLCALLIRSRPVRWLWRTLVANPMAGFFRREVEIVVGPLFEASTQALVAHTSNEERITSQVLDRIDELQHTATQAAHAAAENGRSVSELAARINQLLGQ